MDLRARYRPHPEWPDWCVSDFFANVARWPERGRLPRDLAAARTGATLMVPGDPPWLDERFTRLVLDVDGAVCEHFGTPG